MRKILIILLMLVVTGCQMRILNPNLNKMVDMIMEKNHRPNYVTKGYKMYLPLDAKVHYDKNNNLAIYYQGQYLYMYTDLISFYYKFQENYIYEENNELYFSRKLDYDDKLGYIEVRKQGNKYFVQVMYNYAKIETIVNEHQIYDTVLTSLQMLKSVVYKQKIVEALIANENNGVSKEETFQLFQPKGNRTNFIEYVEEYDKYEGTIELEEPIFDSDQIQLTEELTNPEQ